MRVKTRDVMRGDIAIGYSVIDAIQDDTDAQNALEDMCYYLASNTGKLSPYNEQILAAMAQELTSAIYYTIEEHIEDNLL